MVNLDKMSYWELVKLNNAVKWEMAQRQFGVYIIIIAVIVMIAIIASVLARKK